jgi:hypothetical protein
MKRTPVDESMGKTTAERVKKRREALRAAGLRPVQFWAPDTRRPGFAEECRRQSKLIAEAERDDTEVADILEAALRDLAASGEWT